MQVLRHTGLHLIVLIFLAVSPNLNSWHCFKRAVQSKHAQLPPLKHELKRRGKARQMESNV